MVQAFGKTAWECLQMSCVGLQCNPAILYIGINLRKARECAQEMQYYCSGQPSAGEPRTGNNLNAHQETNGQVKADTVDCYSAIKRNQWCHVGEP